VVLEGGTLAVDDLDQDGGAGRVDDQAEQFVGVGWLIAELDVQGAVQMPAGAQLHAVPPGGLAVKVRAARNPASKIARRSALT
jgi:hypothetical protein